MQPNISHDFPTGSFVSCVQLRYALSRTWGPMGSCQATTELSLCSSCHSVRFCSRDHQRRFWPRRCAAKGDAEGDAKVV